MSNTAVVLAGGLGSRLKPYTIVLPKPLVPIGDVPIVEIIIRQLQYHGFKRIILAVNHQADLIKAFFGNGSKWGLKSEYSLENQPLGTMGPLRLIQDLPEDFLIINGDILTDLNFRQFFEKHKAEKSRFTIASFQRTNVSSYGVLEVSADCTLKGFSEKPRTTVDVSMGVYAANYSILNLIPLERKYGFDELVLELLKSNSPPRIHKHAGHWLDIGIPADCEDAFQQFQEKRGVFLPMM